MRGLLGHVDSDSVSTDSDPLGPGPLAGRDAMHFYSYMINLPLLRFTASSQDPDTEYRTGASETYRDRTKPTPMRLGLELLLEHVLEGLAWV